MSTKIDYTPLTGGLDLVSGAMNVRPGRMSECLNFEQVFGKIGYRRIDGYERFDGRDQPHRATYAVLRFKSGSAAISVGDTVAGTTAAAKVLKVELESGAWGSADAAGRLIVLLPLGVFVADEELKVGATAVAMVDEPAQIGSISEALNVEYAVLAREALRAEIQKVPGSGPVLGVAVYRGDVYAVRNSEDGLSAALYRSSTTGWQSVRSGLLPGGKWAFDVANFSGAATSIALYGCDGKNRPFRWDGAAFTKMDPIFGSEATSTTSNTIGTGSKTFTAVQAARSWTAGQALVISSSANAANRMTGTVTSYTTGTGALVVDVTEAIGSGTFTDWEIGLADFKDKPYLVGNHRDHLFLAYPLGQLQVSNVGDPMTYTTTAALLGMGDEITGLASMRGSVLGVLCLNKIGLLSGTTSLDWQLDVFSQSAGAKRHTTQEMGGNAMFLDERGLTSLQATQKFGAFEPAIFSRDIKPMLDAYTSKIVATRIAKGKFQYRLYADDGVVLTAAILSPESTVNPSDVAFSRWQYAHVVSCVAQGDMEDGADGMFFGTTDGYVMREDVGTSFDGAPINSVLRLHFNHLKSPSNKKRFRKLEMEMDSPDTVAINFRQQFDFADSKYAASVTNQAIVNGGGGQWDASNWDSFYWSLPMVTQAEANIDGVGKNMGLLLWHSSASDRPFTLQGLLLQYTILGLAR